MKMRTRGTWTSVETKVGWVASSSSRSNTRVAGLAAPVLVTVNVTAVEMLSPGAGNPHVKVTSFWVAVISPALGVKGIAWVVLQKLAGVATMVVAALSEMAPTLTTVWGREPARGGACGVEAESVEGE